MFQQPNFFIMYNWLVNHWVTIALVLSELLAFIPAKWNGITQIVYKVLNSIFSKAKAKWNGKAQIVYKVLN